MQEKIAFKFHRTQIKLHILAGLVDPDEGGVFNWLEEVEGLGVVLEEHSRWGQIFISKTEREEGIARLDGGGRNNRGQREGGKRGKRGLEHVGSVFERIELGCQAEDLEHVQSVFIPSKQLHGGESTPLAYGLETLSKYRNRADQWIVKRCIFVDKQRYKYVEPYSVTGRAK
ncbi:hypothetical protein C8R44DRAFT_740698 [Mycena epipterygia]|nr:hypothetical protein C8R44DRAFT_740698 [Mycena epipterygia]